MISNKRNKLPRRVEYTRTFAKSWERYNRAGRRNMNDMIEVMKLLFTGNKLPEEYLDHKLNGAEWEGARELHVGGDFLLVYHIDEKQNLVTFIDLGTHSELFG
ncbi:mRNA interferase YafQ [Photorhabdus australis subsp. thailandensis]|uniref:mRNA interferase YafQ n=1 Tax=Photorhabdus australis subsp. thailandensis TaxID=2805096 RepID=A0A1C0U7D3_9GAMM|nr:type II toxin-antitoxin system YafQ family toxin [Photorhabdus australis]OCQ53795.1 mRNA interferase YafQ [Photorhabdus australis subsp. thailandensis]